MKNFNKLNLVGILLALMGIFNSTFAQVVADPNAPKPQQATILQTSNGAPQVNIQTPSAKGVSINQFKQFDVLKNGVILNNSRTNILTQLGGYIQGNPWLANGSARIIVNQINSSNPSFLNGYIEIAGQRAEVIFANPSGININGGGFINASRVTMTTGIPIINLGGLDGFRVNQGSINIIGDGFDTSGADYTQLLTRSLNLNAGIWANELRVVTGANEFSALNLGYTTIAPSGDAPLLAIDTGVLGGMYSNKIFLFGTEKGIGVNNAGQIGALAGNVTIDVNGMLTNSGTINANGTNDTQIRVNSLLNTGLISAQRNTNIFATDEIRNSGTITAGRELILNSNLFNNSQGVLKGQRLDLNVFGLNNFQGEIQQTGLQSLALNFGNLININGGLIGYPVEPTPEPTNPSETPEPTPSATPPTTAEGGGTTTTEVAPLETLNEGIVNVLGTINNEAGQITANGGIDLTTNTGLVNSGTLNLNRLNVTGNIFDNSNGILTANQAFINTNSFFNRNGNFGIARQLDLISKNLINTGGRITSEVILNTTIEEQILNDDGVLASNGALNIKADSINNKKGVIGSINDLANITTSKTLDNESGSIISATDLVIKSGELNNTKGSIDSTTIDINTSNNQLTNTNGLISGTNVNISSGILNNEGGLLQGSNSLFINTNNQSLFNNKSGENGIISGGLLTVQTGNLFNNFGYIRSVGVNNSTLTGLFENRNGIFVGDSVLNLRANRISSNQFGLIASVNNSVNINVVELLNNAEGTIQSAESIKINSGELDNSKGNIDGDDVEIETNQNSLNNEFGSITANILNIKSGRLNNNGGLLQSLNNLSINTNNQALINTNSGDNGIVSNGLLDLKTGNFNNDYGYFRSQNSILADINGSLSNNSGVFASDSVLRITANSLNGNKDSLFASVNDLAIISINGILNNDSGTIQSATELRINSGEFTNKNGFLNSNIIGINTGNNRFINDGGSINGQNVNLSSGILSNNGGLIQSTNSLGINTNGQDLFNNNSGDNGIISGGLLDLRIGNLFNNSGFIRSQNGLNAEIGGNFFNNSGVFASNAILNLRAKSIGGNQAGLIASVDDEANITTEGLLNNSLGTIQSKTNLNVNSGELDNSKGVLSATQVDINSGTKRLTNDEGSINGETVAINSGTLSNNNGLIQSLNSLNINTNGQDLININSGENGIFAGGLLTLTTGNLNNNFGYIRSQDSIIANLNGNLTNNSGVFASDSVLRIRANSILGNDKGIIASLNDLGNFEIVGLLNNAGGNLQSVTSFNIKSGELINDGGNIDAKVLVIDTNGNRLSNDGGFITGNEVAIKSGFFNNNAGLIQSLNNLDINTNGLDLINTNSGDNGILAGGNLNLTLANLNNSFGYIRTQGTFNGNFSKDFLNNDGVLASDGLLTITANRITGNNRGTIASVNDFVTITTRGLLNNAYGTISSGKTVTLNTPLLDNSNGTIFSSIINLDLGTNSFSNDGGSLIGRDVTIKSGTFSNNGGLIQASNNLTINTNNFSLFNRDSGDGGLVSGGALNLITGNLFNTNGYIRSQATAAINSTGAIDNNGGVIAGNDALNITADSISGNNDGVIASINNEANISTNGLLNNTGGTIQSATNVNIKSGEFNNTNGLTTAESIDINAGTNKLTNDNGFITADNLAINSGLLSNNGGLLQSTNHLRINTNNLGLLNLNSGNRGIISGGNLEINAGSLNNSLGYIRSNGTLSAILGGDLLNNQGVLASNGTLTLRANTLGGNNEGVIASINDFAKLNIIGSLNNAGGTIQGLTLLEINSGALNNSNGSLSANNVNVFAATNILTNDNGSIFGNDVRISTGFLSNNGGLIQGFNNLSLNTNGQDLINTNSGNNGILSGNALTLNVQNLNNSGGYIGVRGNFSLNTANFNNTNGFITGEGETEINASSLTNNNGTIAFQNNVRINLGNGNLFNDGGLITSGGTTSIFAGTINNTNTNFAGKGIEGVNVNVFSNVLNNRKGAIRADELLNLTVSTSIDNSEGLISSTTDVSITDPNSTAKSLTITNTDGKIAANENISIDAKTIGSDGEILANNDLTIKIDEDFINGGNLGAGNNLNFFTKGNFINNGKVFAGFRNTISAQNIFNNANGEFSGTITKLNSIDTITNRGLIDGIQTVVTSGNFINNIGTGRIYGDYLSLGTNTLNNFDETISGTTKSGTIASRGYLDIGAINVNNLNDGFIFSAGDLRFGRMLDADFSAIGKADTITNSSAKIEALGNIWLSANNIRNLNTQLTFGTTASSVYKQTISFSNRTSPGHGCSEYTGVGCNLLSIFPGEYDRSEFQIRPPSPGDDPRERYIFGYLPGGNSLTNLGRIFIENNYTETTTETTVLSSKAGEIISGGNVFFDGNVRNQDSRIIAGGLINQINGSLTNESAQGTRTVTQNGNFIYNDWWADGGKFKSANEFGTINKTLPSTTFELSTTVVQQNTNATSGTAIDSATTNTVNAGADGLGNNGAAVKNVSINSGTVGDANLNSTTKANVKTVDINDAGSVDVFVAKDTKQASVDNGDLNQLETKAVKDAGNNQIEIKTVGAVETNSTNQIGLTDAELNDINNNTPQLVKIGIVDTLMPNSSIFSFNPDASGFLIETDPRFTNYRDWLSSDYMLKALNYDPAIITKRLGDGFYEQKLVREQIAQLTGRRYLEGFGNDDDQYKALMSAGATFASQYDLRPGVALSAEQLARLTSDIVWLVEEEVTLPDGTKTKALVPKVYVLPRESDIDAKGALISGDRINLNLTGDLNNSGTIAGRTVTQITADNLNNIGGRITGNQVDLNARNDINNIGGTIDAKTSAAIKAGRDVNVTTTTSSNQNGTVIDRVAGIYVGDGSMDPTTASLMIDAGRNANLKGAVIANNGAGATVVKAGNDVNLQTVETATVDTRTSKGRISSGTQTQATTTENGTIINGVGDVKLQAKNDVNVHASSVNSVAGDTTIKAGNDVNIISGQATSNSNEEAKSKEKGFLYSKTTNQNNSEKSTTQIGSEVTGKTVNIESGNNTTIQSSSVVSDAGTNITASKNVTITDAQNTSNSTSSIKTKESGIMSGGGASVFIGSKTNTTDSKSSSSQSVSSTVGSLDGNVNIKAGEKYEQKGSDVTAVTGDVNITAKSLDIKAGENTSTSETKTTSKQTGVTVSVSSPIADAAMATVNAGKQVGQSDNARVNAMAGANAGYDAYKTGEAVKDLSKNVKETVENADKINKDGNGVTVANASVTFGSQKSESTTKTSTTEAVASNVTAGGNVNITATGGGKDSNVNITGSNISGDKSVTIKADNDVNITSAQSTSKEESSNKSSGWSAGVTASVGTGGTGLAVTGSVNSGSGQSKGESVTQLNSNITSNGTTKIESGGTTTIAGGQVSGNSVEVDAKELKIESKQDTATYDSKQKNVSVGVSVNVTGIGGSANVSANKSNVTSDYASVNQQSGIIAGDGGYKVTVKENTDLKGGIITSTQKAEDEGKNSITTGTLTSSDIENKSEHKGTGIGINAGAGVNQQKNINEPGKTGVGTNVSQSIGIGSDKDKQTSTTNSGINTSNLTITDEAGQAVTGKTVEQIKGEVKTDTTSDKVAENSGALENTFDKDKVNKELDLQVAVTQEFSKNTQEVRVLINSKVKEKIDTALALDKKSKGMALTEEEKLFLVKYSEENNINLDNLNTTALSDLSDNVKESANKWQNGGVLFDSITGALGAGNIGGTIAQGAAPWVAKGIGDYFKDKKAEGSAGHLLAHAVLGAAVAAAGGDNPFVGGISAATSEKVAPILSKWLYNKDKPEDLSAEQKSTISSIVSLIGVGVGAVAGGDNNVVAGANAAQTAFDDNRSLFDKNKGKFVTKPLILKRDPKHIEEDVLDSLYRQVAEQLAEEYHVDTEYVLQKLKESGYSDSFLTWNEEKITEDKIATLIKNELLTKTNLTDEELDGKSLRDLADLADKNKLNLGSFGVNREFRDGIAKILVYKGYEENYNKYLEEVNKQIGETVLKTLIQEAKGKEDHDLTPEEVMALARRAEELTTALKSQIPDKIKINDFLGELKKFEKAPELYEWTSDQRAINAMLHKFKDSASVKYGYPILEIYAEFILPMMTPVPDEILIARFANKAKVGSLTKAELEAEAKSVFQQSLDNAVAAQQKSDEIIAASKAKNGNGINWGADNYKVYNSIVDVENLTQQQIVLLKEGNVNPITGKVLKVGTEIGDIHPQTGKLIVGKIENELIVMDPLVQMTKPSAKQNLTTFYEINPPHVKGLPTYDKTKNPLPSNHIELFQQSKPYIQTKDGRWIPVNEAVTSTPKKEEIVRFAVDAEGNVHRFQPSVNGNAYHWNGQSNGVDGFGNPRPLSPKLYPNNLQQKKKGN